MSDDLKLEDLRNFDDGVTPNKWAADRIEALEAENARLSKWAALGEWVMAAWPELGDLDGFTLEELAVKAGVLVEIPGGYDPDHHIDSVGVAPERGDPWFEMIPRPTLPNEDT